MRAKKTVAAQAQTPGRTPPPGDDLPNDEWELQELIERFSAEIDKVQDTLSLKSLARGMTFGPGALTLQLNAFLRYDARRDKILFRSARPGEMSASTLKVELPPILRDQIQTHGIQFKDAPGACPLAHLAGITRAEMAQFNRLGVFTLDDLKAMTITPDMRTMVAAKTGISFERLSGWMGWPFVSLVRPSGSDMFVLGDRFGKQRPKSQVLLDNVFAPVLDWNDNLVRVKVPEGKRSGIVVLINEQGGSNCHLWSPTAVTRGIPARDIPGISAAFVKPLAKARINTVEKLLTLEAGRLAQILQASRRKAESLLQSARGCLTSRARPDTIPGL